MNETNDTATRTARSGKTLSLKKTETSTVKQSFSHGRTKAVLVEAADGAEDGRRKLVGMAAARGLHVDVVDCLTCTELSLALGRENVVHAALNPGRLSERVRREAGRLRGFRPASVCVGP